MGNADNMRSVIFGLLGSVYVQLTNIICVGIMLLLIVRYSIILLKY